MQKDLITISGFKKKFTALLPETYRILALGNLVVHPSVSRITLHGSRGPMGGYRPDSDIDLGLHINMEHLAKELEAGSYLKSILEITLNCWQGKNELDIAAIFDKKNCGLKCFDSSYFDEILCPGENVACLGLYKIQKGFNGFVDGLAVQVKRMYPCLTIWRNRN